MDYVSPNGIPYPAWTLRKAKVITTDKHECSSIFDRSNLTLATRDGTKVTVKTIGTFFLSEFDPHGSILDKLIDEELAESDDIPMSSQKFHTSPAAPASDTVSDRGTLQRSIIEYKKKLHRAYEEQNTLEASQIQKTLIEYHIAFCASLRHEALPPEEIERLRRYFASVLQQQEFERAYKNVCWACKAQVNNRYNDACSDCGWLVCVCGACQSPEFANGVRGNQSECKEQIQRLGLNAYKELSRLLAKQHDRSLTDSSW